MLRPLCVRWAYMSGNDAQAEHPHKELERMLSIRGRSWSVFPLFKPPFFILSVKITNFKEVPSYHAEHTRKELVRMLSIHISNWCICSACASVPYAYAQHAHQFLMRMLSMVCRNLYNERPLKNGKTDAYVEHSHQFLTRMLSMRTSALRVCSACASVPDAYAQHNHKGRSIRVRK